MCTLTQNMYIRYTCSYVSDIRLHLHLYYVMYVLICLRVGTNKYNNYKTKTNYPPPKKKESTTLKNYKQPLNVQRHVKHYAKVKQKHIKNTTSKQNYQNKLQHGLYYKNNTKQLHDAISLQRRNLLQTVPPPTPSPKNGSRQGGACPSPAFSCVCLQLFVVVFVGFLKFFILCCSAFAVVCSSLWGAEGLGGDCLQQIATLRKVAR